ncbi:hypothetical protein T4D_621, partial [Trichinella pseudospiralis]
LPCAGVHSTEQACRDPISKLLTRGRFTGSLHKRCGLSWLKKTDFLICVSVQMGEWKFYSTTTVESKSHVMGEISHESGFNITDVICAPSMRCVAAADSFIKGFERDQKGKMKNLNIKIDGGLSESIEGYYLQKQFRSLALERGYAVDEVYEYELNMPKRNCDTFDSWGFHWDFTQMLWFIMVEEDDLLLFRLGAESDEANVWSSSSLTMTETKSREMGKAAQYMRYNITNVICAPSIKCIAAAHSFIKGFEGGKKYQGKPLNIKIEGGLSETVEGYCLQKQFQSFVAESGYPIDESYETCIKWPGGSSIDPYVNLAWRINEAVKSMMRTYSGAIEQIVAIFVDRSLERMLRCVMIGPPLPFILRVPPIPDSLYVTEGDAKGQIFNNGVKTLIVMPFFKNSFVVSRRRISVDSSDLACGNLILALLTRGRFAGILHTSCEDVLPFLRLGAGRKEEGVRKSGFATMTEKRSRAMGTASHYARFNIVDVICAPSFTCITAADNFIKGFEGGLKDEIKVLDIKVDGGLSSSVEGYYLQKQFLSLAAEGGYRVDETYETSVKCPENCKIDPYINLYWRINAALESIRKKYSGSMDKMVVVFVDKSLESLLKEVLVGLPAAFKVHVPSVGISPSTM